MYYKQSSQKAAKVARRRVIVLQQKESEQAMLLKDYVNDRLDGGETDTVIEGLQNTVNTNLNDALKSIPPEDWLAEISNRQKEADGQTLIWLAGRSDPSYSIQE
jgi:hypothetical protein